MAMAEARERFLEGGAVRGAKSGGDGSYGSGKSDRLDDTVLGQK